MQCYTLNLFLKCFNKQLLRNNFLKMFDLLFDNIHYLFLSPIYIHIYYLFQLSIISKTLKNRWLIFVLLFLITPIDFKSPIILGSNMMGIFWMEWPPTSLYSLFLPFSLSMHPSWSFHSLMRIQWVHYSSMIRFLISLSTNLSSMHPLHLSPFSRLPLLMLLSLPLTNNEKCYDFISLRL